MPKKFTDAHLDELTAKGYLIVPDYYSGEQLSEMQAAQRRVLPTWEEVKDDPPPGGATLTEFPPSEMALLRGIVDHEAWAFARKFLKTEHIHYRAGCMIVRYPGFKGPGVDSDPSNLHIDNGNNSLLPQSESAREFGQIAFGYTLRMLTKTKHHLDYLLRSMNGILLNMNRLFVKPEPSVSLTTTRCTQQAIICGRWTTLYVGIRFGTGRSLLGRLQTLYGQRSERDLLEIHRHVNSSRA